MLVLLVDHAAAALALSAAALLVYELRHYRESWLDDLRTQADLIARASAPALAFDDPRVARQNLASLQRAAADRGRGGLPRRRPAVRDLRRAPRRGPMLPGRAAAAGLPLRRRAPRAVPADRGERRARSARVYLRARYDAAAAGCCDYMAILARDHAGRAWRSRRCVFERLQHAVTRPILAVADVAREVVRAARLLAARAEDHRRRDRRAGRRLQQHARDPSVRAERSSRPRRRCAASPTGARTSSSPRSRTSCATRWRRMRNALEILRARRRRRRRCGERLRDIMERQVRQMVRLIDDLLDVSRITTGKLAAARASRSICVAVLHAAIETVDAADRERGHTLDVALPPQPVWVDADATRLAQVFANLLNNAAKYTDPGGRIAAQCRSGRAATWTCVSATTASASRRRMQEHDLRDVRAGRQVARARPGRPRRRA